MAGNSRKAILAAAGANFGISIAKFVGFAVTGASSMLAEGVHSVADTANQVLLLWGSARAEREADTLHPFGYGRERYFWSFVVAMVLFTLGSLFAIYEGVHKLQHPEPVKSPMWAVGILLVGIVLEGLSFRTAIVESRKIKGNASWWDFIRKSRTPELPVVLLEDLGALAGLVIALAGVGLTMATQNPIFDAASTLAIGVLLGIIAIILAWEMKSLLIGEGADARTLELLSRVAQSHPNVDRIIHTKTLHLAPEEVLVASKMDFVGVDDLGTLAVVINDVEAQMRAACPDLKLRIYIEADRFDENLAKASAEPQASA